MTKYVTIKSTSKGKAASVELRRATKEKYAHGPSLASTAYAVGVRITR